MDDDDRVEPEGARRESQKDLKGCHFAAVIRSGLQFSWREEREAKWETAIRRWHSLIMSVMDDSVLVRADFRGETFKAQSQVLVDVFLKQSSSNSLEKVFGTDSNYK